jgi:hypothetical protein
VRRKPFPVYNNSKFDKFHHFGSRKRSKAARLIEENWNKEYVNTMKLPLYCFNPARWTQQKEAITSLDRSNKKN